MKNILNFVLLIGALLYFAQIFAFQKVNLSLKPNTLDLSKVHLNGISSNVKLFNDITRDYALLDSVNGFKSKKNDISLKPFNVIGIGKSGVPFIFSGSSLSPTYRFSYLEVNFEKYFLKDIGNLTSSIIGIGTSVKNMNNYFDSISYRNTMVTFDILYRTYLSKRFFVKIGLSPILNNHSVYKLNHHPIVHSWKLNRNVEKGFRSTFILGIGYSLFKNLEIKLNYLYLPNYLYIDKIRSSYLNYGLYFSL